MIRDNIKSGSGNLNLIENYYICKYFIWKYGSRKQEMVQNSYLTDTQWVLLVSSLGCIIENGQKMERKGGSSVTKSFDKR